MGVSDADGITPLIINVTAAHQLMCSDGAGGSDNGRTPAVRDENSVPVLMAVSSSDGVTPVEIYIDHLTSNLLVKST